MTLTLRPIDPATDFPRLAEIRSAAMHDPYTAEILRTWHAQAQSDQVCLSLVAVCGDGEIVGYGEVRRNSWDAAGEFQIAIAVDPPGQRRGIGAALYDALALFAAAHAASTLQTRVHDDCAAGVRFAAKRGFILGSHTFGSVLDIAAFEANRFAGQIEAVEASGIRFFSFADTDGGEEAQRRLWELNTLASVGMPGYDVSHARPFEQFVKDVCEGYWFRADGQILAADGDRWIGMAAVGEMKPGEMSNTITAVSPDFRGRGIATALKLLAVRCCRKHNARTLRTHNRSENAPMLAINRKLGYQPEPGYYILRKTIKPALLS